MPEQALRLVLIGMVMAGFISQYSQGVMEGNQWRSGTVAIRQRLGDLPAGVQEQTDCFVATRDCDLVGREVYLSIEGSEWEHCYVADCSGHAETTRWMTRGGVICEVGYLTAQKHGFVGRGGILGELLILDSEKWVRVYDYE